MESAPLESALRVVINGVPRTLEGLDSPSPLTSVLEHLELRPDRIAVELNGEIAPRTKWSEMTVADKDRIEVVHFVGGGRSPSQRRHPEPYRDPRRAFFAR